MSMIPYGLYSIAAFLESRKHDVSLANFSKLGFREAASLAAKEKPELIGVSIFSFNRYDSFAFIKEVRRLMPNVKICIGGPHADFFSDEILKRYSAINAVIKGEGEEAFASLADAIERSESFEPIIIGERIKNIDALPLPLSFQGKMIGINNNEQLKVIITSRGCPSNCTFCSSPQFWSRRVSFRSAKSIADEIETIYKKFGIIYFSIRDDNFTLKKDRVIEVCDLLIKRKLFLMWNCQARVDTIDIDMLKAMKLAGLEHIQLGVESGSQKMLDKYNKGIRTEDIIKAADITRSAGISLSIYLMTGMLEETGKDVQETVEIIKKIRPMDGMVSPVAYYPGTALYDEMKLAGKVSNDIWFNTKESGIFLRKDIDAEAGMMRILRELDLVGSRAAFTRADFKKHRAKIGECWITDVMEGDFLRNAGDLTQASNMYTAMIDKNPENIWAYLRMGSLFELVDDYESAFNFYDKAKKLLPPFFGSWMKASEALFMMKRKTEAITYAQQALKLNPFDERVIALKKKLKI